ncbi:MAG: hypothetical protein AB7F08_06850 [Dongiaceae bacterium]|jgi:hypothetical protein
MNDRDRDEARRRLRARNYAVLAALLGFAILVYVVSILRMGGN